MPRHSKGARLGLDEPLASDFLDFRTANYSAAEIEVIRVALREHIDRRLKHEPELRKLFEAARTARVGAREKLKLIKTPDT